MLNIGFVDWLVFYNLTHGSIVSCAEITNWSVRKGPCHDE